MKHYRFCPTYDWKADSDYRWTVPLGGGMGKIFRIGYTAGERADSGVLQPDDGGSDGTLRLQLQFLFPN